MTTTTLSARNENRFENGKDLEKVIPAHPASAATAAELVQAWFDSQALPILPLHLQLMLMES